MKILQLLIAICCFSLASGQTVDTTLEIHNTGAQTDSLISLRDTTPPPLNEHTRLLTDHPAYNPKYAYWKPMVRVLSANVFNWALARYVYKFDWAKVSTSDWKNNIQKGPVWDEDGFGINFIGHPHTGSIYYNVARSNGYSYWQSIPFVLQGSLTWEYLGENERPSYNDLINTPISGMFLGEVFYRISSNILDDRKKGRRRFGRELFAGLINPTRALNRLTQGKMFWHTTEEVYQKEPLSIFISGGLHKVNNKAGKDNLFATGQTNALLNLQLDYGDPFETRKRKPFDYFRFRIELSYGDDRKLLDMVNGYGILAGKNNKPGKSLIGIFQHYDYWKNSIFEVASLGFGGGIISRGYLSKKASLYSSIHLAIIPLAGNNTESGPQDSDFRQYNFGSGMQVKVDEMLHLGKNTRIGMSGYYYWIRTFEGLPGHSLVGVFRPIATIRLFKNLWAGIEHHIYRNDRFLPGKPALHITRTEQKFFLQLNLEHRKQHG